MKTDFEMLRELKKTYGNQKHEFGIFTGDEATLIQETLCLDDRDILSLRNLRNFAVLFWKGKDTDDFDLMMKLSDEISAITYLIDSKIWEKGGDV